MESILDINKLNIISDNDYYYFFRALNNDDHNDLVEGINNTNGKITKIRTDLSRYEGIPNYLPNSNISLEEVNDHIKWAHTKDTNCISLSSNANVIATYGRSNYHDEYVMIKIKKSDIDKDVYLAVDYIGKEVEKRIKELSNNIDSNKKYYLDFIDNITTDKELEQFKKNIKNQFKLTDTTDSSTLDRDSFLNLKKLILKLDVLEQPISPKITNRTLIETIKFAYSSSEFIHYKEIPGEKITKISSEVLDIFSLLQQLPFNKEVEEIENILLSKINDSNKEFDFNKNNLDDSEFSIAKMYDLSSGSIDYGSIVDTVKKAYYLAKSRLRVIHTIDKLNEILDYNPKYKDILDKIKDTTYGVEPEISSRLDTNSMYLSESVSLNVNKTEQKLLELVNSFSKDELTNIVSNEPNYLFSKLYSYINEEYENISGYKKEPVSENEYYVEAILNSLDIKTIYPNSIKEKKLTPDEKFIISNKLYKGNCKNLYNAFLKAGVDKNKIPYYIVNLYLSNGYKGYNFYDFSVLPELDEIIYKNINNLNVKVSALDFDNLREIKDDHNVIEKTNINLRDYQINTVNNIKKIYETKRFSGVVLPTGAGKSFVAITMMLEYQNKNIVYIAPNVGINRQVQKHIIKNVIGYNKPYEEISKMLEEPNKYEMYIKQYFPYLKFYCYQGMSNKEQDELANLNADLIILDELHRTGADSWSKTISDLVTKNKDAKVLGLTATPVRTDGEDMTRKVAGLTGDYSERELILDKHLAVNMNLIDAIRDDIVVAPKIVSFDYNLINSDEFEEIKEKYEKETNPEKKAEYKQIYDKMINLLSKSESKGLSKIIEDNLKDKYGKYLVFLPRMSSDYDSDSEKYFKEEMDKFASNIASIDSNPIQRYIYSDKSNKENDKELTDFELDESSHIKTLYAVDMLNEGIHVDNISGSFMFRSISSSKILYLQQLGRTVYSKDPDHIYTDEERPIVFDYYNNYFILNMDRMVNKTDATADLERLKSIYKWINKHGFIPDINSSNLSEARKAITLKKIKSKYTKYLNANNLNELDEIKKNTIIEILEIANEMNLFSIEFPDRIIPPGEKNLENNATFELSATQKELLELVSESRNIGKNKESLKQMTKRARYKMCLQVLDVLDEYSFVINEKTIPLEMTMKELKQQLEKYAIDTLKNMGIPDDYPIGEEYNSLKEDLYSTSQLALFQEMDLDTLINYGLYSDFYKTTESTHKVTFLEDDIIVKGPRKYVGFNIKTRKKEDITFKTSSQIVRLLTVLVDSGIEINNKLIPYNLVLGSLLSKVDKEVATKLYKFNLSNNYEIGKEYNKLKSSFYRKNNLFDELDLDTALKYGLFEDFIGGYGVKGCVNNNYIVNGPDRFIGYNIVTKERRIIEVDDFIHRSDLTIILDLLSKSSFEINRNTIPLNMTLGQLKSKLDDETREELEKFGYNDNYEIGNKYNNLKYLLYSKGDDKMFEDLDIATAVRLGLLTEFYNKCSLNFSTNGFIVAGPRKFFGYNEKTGTKYDEEGYDRKGKDRYNFDRNHIHEVTGTIYDEHGFDYKKINRETGTFLDKNNFDIDGFYYKEVDGKMISTKKKINERGFNIDERFVAYDNYTTRLYDEEGYDFQGYNKEGYNKEGYDRLGYNKKGFNKKHIHKITNTQYDMGGFDEQGRLNPEIRERNKVLIGRIGVEINDYGFSADGFYWKKCIDGSCNKTNLTISPDGFDYNGTFKKIHDEEITIQYYNDYYFDRDGYYWELKDGKRIKTNRKLDNHHFNRQGFYFILQDGKYVNTNSTYDEYGFTITGKNKKQFSEIDSLHDKRGFDINHINKFTNKPYDQRNFDIDGYYWKLQGEERVKTDRKVNEEGIDSNGNKWLLDESGNPVSPAPVVQKIPVALPKVKVKKAAPKKEENDVKEYLKERDEAPKEEKITKIVEYDEKFFALVEEEKPGSTVKDYHSINLITGTPYDIRGFNVKNVIGRAPFEYRNGKLVSNTVTFTTKIDLFDAYDFDSKGIHKVTKKPYDSLGYNAFRVDENGYKKDKTRHPDIVFTEKYFDLIEKDIDPLTDEELNKYLDEVLTRINNKVSREQLVKIIIYAATQMYPKIIDKIPHKMINNVEIKQEVVNIDEIISNAKLNIDKNPRLFISKD